jgi:hypothetical protein
MIDLKTEVPISLAQATRFYPQYRRGKPPHESMVLRHILKGSRAPDGSVVRLEGLRLGGRWITTAEAIQRFAERLTPGFDTPPAGRPPNPAPRSSSTAKANRELKAAGF